MSDVSSKNSVLPSQNPSSLSGNSASYQSGGKKRRSKKTIKRSRKGSKSRRTKRCWWKLW
jgi:hypothetical protein